MTYDYVDTDSADSADGESWGGDSAYDTYEGENWDSWEAKAKKRQPQRPVQTATGANPYRSRPPAGAGSGSVTQAQLEASLARVRQEIRANATGIKTLDGRVRSAAADQQRFQTAARKQVDALRGELKTTQTLSALIPLIAPAGSRFATVAPLAHLLVPQYSASTAAGSPGGIGGMNTTTLVTVGALLYASGSFGTPAVPATPAKGV